MSFSLTLRNIGRKMLPNSLRNKVHLFLIDFVKSRDGSVLNINPTNNIPLEDRELIGIIHTLDRRISSIENEIWMVKAKIQELTKVN